MKYIFKPKNRIECISRHGDYHGFFVIKNIELVISSKNCWILNFISSSCFSTIL